MRDFVCGTRAVVKRGPLDYRIVCATCGGGGTVRYEDKTKAHMGAIRDSNKPCQCRGCGAT